MRKLLHSRDEVIAGIGGKTGETTCAAAALDNERVRSNVEKNRIDFNGIDKIDSVDKVGSNRLRLYEQNCTAHKGRKERDEGRVKRG